jgi:hypothetical protein
MYGIQFDIWACLGKKLKKGQDNKENQKNFNIKPTEK